MGIQQIVEILGLVLVGVKCFNELSYVRLHSYIADTSVMHRKVSK